MGFVMFLPTSRVDVYRDSDSTDLNIFGDPTETGSTRPLMPSVPVSVAEESEDRSAPADLSAETIRTFVMRAARHWGIREGDRLREPRTGVWYQVQKVHTPQSILGVMPCRLVCKQIGT